MEISSNGGGFFDDADELLNAIESELGPEAAEAIRLSRERRLHPRELTDSERREFRTVLDPVLRDLQMSGAIVPDVREQPWEDDPDFVFGWIESASSGLGIRIQLDLSAAERLADVADQVQEWEVEELAAEGRPATWPECPEHPDSHPLSPEVRDSRALWCCPKSGHAIHPIGALGLSSPVASTGAVWRLVAHELPPEGVRGARVAIRRGRRTLPAYLADKLGSCWLIRSARAPAPVSPVICGFAGHGFESSYGDFPPCG